jgi:hypothetical protein
LSHELLLLGEEPLVFALLLLEEVLEAAEVLVGGEELLLEGVDACSEFVVLLLVEFDEFVVLACLIIFVFVLDFEGV